MSAALSCQNCKLGKGILAFVITQYLFDELTFFQPRPQELNLTDPREQRGIHCRFVMPGIIAENHFDSSRNAIVNVEWTAAVHTQSS
jgi:hypothetical protein